MYSSLRVGLTQSAYSLDQGRGLHKTLGPLGLNLNALDIRKVFSQSFA